MIWLIIGFIVIVIFLLMISAKLNVHIYFKYKDKLPLITIKIQLYKLILIQKEWKYQREDAELWDVIDEMDIQQEIQSFQKGIKTFRDKLKDISILTHTALRSIHFQQWEWYTTFGTGNASSTGILAGSLWMAKGSIISLLNEYSHVHVQPKLSVQPHFQQKLLQSEFRCIVSIRLGKAIYMLMKLIQIIPAKKEALT